VLAGFALFFLMEQFLAWHHTHSMPVAVKQPVTYLILLADGLHSFIAASDLVPEVKHDRLLRNNLIHFASFVAGMLVILATRLLLEP
jgi:zinc transporter ZupT